MPDIKLWYSPGACSLAPHVLLHEIGLPFDGIETSVAKGANLTEEFARINPKKRVPVLSLNGEVTRRSRQSPPLSRTWPRSGA